MCKEKQYIDYMLDILETVFVMHYRDFSQSCVVFFIRANMSSHLFCILVTCIAIELEEVQRRKQLSMLTGLRVVELQSDFYMNRSNSKPFKQMFHILRNVLIHPLVESWMKRLTPMYVLKV